jgi:hypothetical protein
MRFLWLFILLITGLAHGETIPSIEKPGKVVSPWFLVSWDGTGAETAKAACALIPGNWVQDSDILNHGQCLNGYNNRIWMQEGVKCEDGSVAVPLLSSYCAPSYSCPDTSWTLSPDKRSCSRTCPVAPLTPITDPIAQQFERGENPVIEDKLTDSMKTALACLRREVTAAKGTLTVTSAWRPQLYQDHLREIFTKNIALQKIANPACADIKKAIKQEFRRHGLQGRVAINSPHTAGKAFDATWSVKDIDGLANKCGLYRPFPVDDRVHFIAK